ncbi:MAG: CPBP family intramembrane glutamic endopeptidase [Pirellulaceae bacterium]
MVQVLIGILNLTVVAALVGCVVGWIFGFLRLRNGEPLLQPESRVRPLVGFAEVIMAVGLYFVLMVAGMNVAAPLGWIETRGPGSNEPIALDPDFAARVTIDGISKVAAVALLLIWLSFLDQHALRRLGMIPRFRDLKIGLITAAMLIPPVLILQQLLNLLTPYEHPVKDLIEARPTLLIGLLLAANTVLIAPFAEEFFFRGLLQGWFQRLSRRGIVRSLATERGETAVERNDAVVDRDEAEFHPEQRPAEEASRNPYQAFDPRAAEPPEAAPSVRTEWIAADEVQHWPWWPMLLTSLLFGLIHWGQGAAPVSLFFLAMGLSYVTRQTGSLWPAITVHFALNACATAAMFLSTGVPTDPPPLGP